MAKDFKEQRAGWDEMIATNASNSAKISGMKDILNKQGKALDKQGEDISEIKGNVKVMSAGFDDIKTIVIDFKEISKDYHKTQARVNVLWWGAGGLVGAIGIAIAAFFKKIMLLF